MMARWVKAHEKGDHLDLRISSFLARETIATTNARVENKKMAVPQSLLYDLEFIREFYQQLDASTASSSEYSLTRTT